ncbi:MAG TPA: plastocyanin/azurin family copper-binding protein [Gemmatimonadales bacterium]|nr:plastocyanin/azurin family copper-binding protein [Gemmatimonadales bacterium]
MRVAPEALLLLTLLGCGSDATEPPLATPPDVLIVSGASGQGANAYDPSPFVISLASKTTVKWRNNDPTVPNHTITADAGAFTSSGSLADGETFTATFTVAGTYTYHCSVHPTMTGIITVNP